MLTLSPSTALLQEQDGKIDVAREEIAALVEECAAWPDPDEQKEAEEPKLRSQKLKLKHRKLHTAYKASDDAAKEAVAFDNSPHWRGWARVGGRWEGRTVVVRGGTPTAAK